MDQNTSATGHMRRIGYLSGAPRVSTHPQAAAAGPRAHMLGVIEAFRRLGWEVRPFITGDKVPSTIARATGASTAHSLVRRLVRDIARLSMGRLMPRQAVRQIGSSLQFVYERFAAMQSLGRAFQRRGIPWVLETNGPFFYEAKVERNNMALTGLARRLEIRAYRQCDVLVCISPLLKQVVVDAAGINPNKVIVVPNGVDPQRFSPRPRPAMTAEGELTIGFVGAVLPWQGLNLLLDALARVRCQGVPVQVTVVGDGAALPELRAQAHRLNIAEHIRFVGHVSWEDVPGHMATFDVGYSGQVMMKIGAMYHSPLKLYEYMAMGLPVLASAFDDAAALAQSTGAGFLFEPGCIDSLAARLAEIHQQRKNLAAMGRRARQVIVKEHSWDSRVSNMLEHIAYILRKSHWILEV